MVVNHANSILFVASSSAIYAYSISSSGSLTALSSGGATGFSNIVSMDVSPDGQWLFVLDDNSSAPSLDEYSINSSTGALANPKVSLFASASPVSPQAVKVSPNGAYVFVALGTAGDMVFPLTTSTGALGTALPLTGSATVSDNALTVDPTSTYLYIARSSGTTGSVVAYSIGTGGALTLVNSYPAGDDPYSVGMNTTGTYLYVANLLDSTISISGYSVATNGGALTSLGTAYSGGSGVNGLAADKSGDYVLAINSGGSPGLSMYSYDSTTPGTLDPAASATTGTGTKAIAVTH
jgi:6-phosphogluconolactonase (cycloisomerase 2 family)